MQKRREWKNQVWWSTPVIPALRRLRQEDWMLAASLGYIVRPVSKQTHEKAKFISFIICLI
jgi:hypothetical protein